MMMRFNLLSINYFVLSIISIPHWYHCQNIMQDKKKRKATTIAKAHIIYDVYYNYQYRHLRPQSTMIGEHWTFLCIFRFCTKIVY